MEYTIISEGKPSQILALLEPAPPGASVEGNCLSIEIGSSFDVEGNPMQCPRCGQDSAEAAQFCATCGQSLANSKGESPPAVPLPGYGVPSLDLSGGPASVPIAGPPLAFATPCRVCGMLVSSQTDRCPRCGSPIGMIVNPNDSTATDYLPVAGDPSSIAMTGVNTSGKHGEVPLELQKGWNWGASFVTFFWAITHRVWWYVGFRSALFIWNIFVAILAYVNKDPNLSLVVVGDNVLTVALWIGFRIYFGIRGNSIAWKFRQFENPYHCLYVQDAWKPWGIVFFVLAMISLLFVVAVVVFFAVVAAGMK